jgi:lysozyme
MPAVTVAAEGDQLQGVDVSSNQHSGDAAIDWWQVRGAGYAFALVKATEGDYYRNPYFAADYEAAKAAGLYRGAYHFAIPSAGDGAGQADFFLDAAGYSADGWSLAPGLDLEWNPYNSGSPCYGLDQGEMVSWVAAFRDEVQRRVHRLPAIYTTASWWDECTGGDSSFGNSPLWVAAYEVSAPPIPSGWSSPTLWQYTEHGRVPGVPGEVDVNSFYGSQRDLDVFAGRPRPPAAAPPPVARPG